MSVRPHIKHSAIITQKMYTTVHADGYREINSNRSKVINMNGGRQLDSADSDGYGQSVFSQCKRLGTPPTLVTLSCRSHARLGTGAELVFRESLRQMPNTGADSSSTKHNQVFLIFFI